MDFQKSFGTSVRAWRGRLGFSQEQLAERAGLHRTYVCDIERGARNVSLKSVEKLARALEVSVPKLFSYNPETPLGKEPARPLLSEDLVDILMVEDDAADIELTLAALRSAKITNRFHIARDGVEALNYLFGTGEFPAGKPPKLPDVILLDLNLPKIRGLDVLSRVKHDPLTHLIPVVVLTASKKDRDIALSKQLGADAYIIKPVDLKSLSEVTPKLSLQWALLKPLAALNA